MAHRNSIMDNLEREGWTRQFTACEPRLSEAVELYKESGFEVRLEPLPKGKDRGACGGTEDQAECGACFEGVEDQYRIIFTRPVKGGPEHAAGLFT